MMQVLAKTHEQRIVELEAQVAELLRIVGRPSLSVGLGGLHAGMAQPNGNVQSPNINSQLQGGNDLQKAQAEAAAKLAGAQATWWATRSLKDL